MSAIHVRIYHVDGSLSEADVGSDILRNHALLVSRGLEGWQLIHAPWSDDLRPKPRSFNMTGTGPDGRAVDITIPYN